MPPSRGTGTKHPFESRENPPPHYLIAHSDGGARGNPGPAGYGVVIEDEAGRKVAALSEYLGHQTNNFAEYQGLILLVRQLKGIYKVKNATLQDLHGRAKELIAQLEWFSIGHALRQHNQEADHLANEAMDKGMGRASTDRVARALPSAGSGHALPANPSIDPNLAGKEFEGVIRNGVVELVGGKFPEGTRVQVRAKK